MQNSLLKMKLDFSSPAVKHNFVSHIESSRLEIKISWKDVLVGALLSIFDLFPKREGVDKHGRI